MLRELNVVEQRYRAVLEVLSGTPVIEVAERYGVVRQTVHRWVARYRTEGLDGLADRSHAPRQHPWRIPAEVEALICELRRAHRRWGPRRLVFEMGRRASPGLSRSTVYRVLVRHQLIQPVPRHQPRHQTAQGLQLRPRATLRQHHQPGDNHRMSQAADLDIALQWGTR
jgi:transposase